MRDTDADWRDIGAAFPFWGVLTSPEYRHTELSSEIIDGFYSSGRQHIASTVERLKMVTAAPLSVARALDFGCGAGRLTEAMTAFADVVTGVDISPGMLEQARRHGGGKALYADSFPEGPFDWINSYIVFQHIPPERGSALLELLLAKLAPGGLISLHFTFYREPHLRPQASSPKGLFGWRKPKVLDAAPVGAMSMYDYDITAILGALRRHGVEQVTLLHTDHGGHHGEMIFGRRR